MDIETEYYLTANVLPIIFFSLMIIMLIGVAKCEHAPSIRCINGVEYIKSDDNLVPNYNIDGTLKACSN